MDHVHVLFLKNPTAAVFNHLSFSTSVMKQPRFCNAAEQGPRPNRQHNETEDHDWHPVLQEKRLGLGREKKNIEKSHRALLNLILTPKKRKQTATNLPTRGRLPKLTNQAVRELIKKVTKRAKVALKELQSCTTQTEATVYRSV